MITLGQASNYGFGRTVRHLLAWGTKQDFAKLRQGLAEHYQVQPENVALYHTGRSALTAALKAVAPSGGVKVFVPGLTCIAVVRAIKAAGCEPVFVDIVAENLEYDYDKLEKELQKNIELARKTSEDSLAKSSERRSQQESLSEKLELARKTSKKESGLSFSSDAEQQEFLPEKLELARKTSKKESGLSFSSDAEQQEFLQKTLDKNNSLCYNRDIILVQSTLGQSWHAEKIQKIAQKYDLAIVEDLAHSAGRNYVEGTETGLLGAAAALSFGKGKAIDTISGGAVILRNQQVADQPTLKPKLADRWRDRWYPVFGGIARALWRCKVGRVVIGGLVKIGWVQRSADAELNLLHRLTYWQAKLAHRQLQTLPQTPLRDYRLVQSRAEILQKLQQAGYCLEEIWYDTPVSPARYAEEANFPAAKCPETVRIAQQIINIPTWYSKEKMQKAYEIIDIATGLEKSTSKQLVVSERLHQQAKTRPEKPNQQSAATYQKEKQS